MNENIEFLHHPPPPPPPKKKEEEKKLSFSSFKISSIIISHFLSSTVSTINRCQIANALHNGTTKMTLLLPWNSNSRNDQKTPAYCHCLNALICAGFTAPTAPGHWPTIPSPPSCQTLINFLQLPSVQLSASHSHSLSPPTQSSLLQHKHRIEKQFLSFLSLFFISFFLYTFLICASITEYNRIQ